MNIHFGNIISSKIQTVNMKDVVKNQIKVIFNEIIDNQSTISPYSLEKKVEAIQIQLEILKGIDDSNNYSEMFNALTETIDKEISIAKFSFKDKSTKSKVVGYEKDMDRAINQIYDALFYLLN